MADLLTRSDHSLIMQSFKARERQEPLNGDGFGVGWYSREIDDTPCVFTSITPAWSNRNLHRLADKITSDCFFAHVRAAGRTGAVSELNCHPFQFEQFLWMHNGRIADFSAIKRRLRDVLNDDVYNFIQGSTDTEHAFAVFLNYLWRYMEDYSIETMKQAMLATIRQIVSLCVDAGITDPCYLNFAVTDGNSVVATRYVFPETMEAQTLYYLQGERYEGREGVYRMTRTVHRPQAVIVASEPLTVDKAAWKAVAANSLLTVTPELHVREEPIKI